LPAAFVVLLKQQPKKKRPCQISFHLLTLELSM
jgi:hypothetical protein